jgi:hypothetical protein
MASLLKSHFDALSEIVVASLTPSVLQIANWCFIGNYLHKAIPARSARLVDGSLSPQSSRIKLPALIR